MPISSRYVGRYRHEAIQCRECNIRLTYLRIAGFYVNPGLLRRISRLRIASAVAASQRRTGRSPALSRRIAPGRWTTVAPRRDDGHNQTSTPRNCQLSIDKPSSLIFDI
ncbi:MAG: hypothetical protein LBM98_04230 [Oscillospiraceae bacterium]|nr:hypothetical protein [Oscillospiraceae bacterium]